MGPHSYTIVQIDMITGLLDTFVHTNIMANLIWDICINVHLYKATWVGRGGGVSLHFYFFFIQMDACLSPTLTSAVFRCVGPHVSTRKEEPMWEWDIYIYIYIEREWDR